MHCKYKLHGFDAIRDRAKRLSALWLLLLVMGCTQAAPPEAPSGDAVLTISGAIGASNMGEALALDFDQLESLPQHSITTTTRWTPSRVTFQGPLVHTVLAKSRPQANDIIFTARDGYQVQVALSDLKAHRAMMATRLDGERFGDAAFGPLWIVYDYDRMAADDRERAEETMSPWAVTGARIIADGD